MAADSPSHQRRLSFRIRWFDLLHVKQLKCRSLLPHLAMYCADINIVHLPLEVFQRISKYLTAQEWAKGPSQTCKFLNNMRLPSLVLKHIQTMLDSSTVSLCPPYCS